MTTPYRRSGALAVLAAAAVIGLAGCGGSGSPDVASLGKSTGNGSGSATTSPGKSSAGGNRSATTLPTGNPSQLVDEWGACMRSHGDPDQADPTVDVHGVIHISWNPAIPGGYNGTNKGGEGNSGPGQFCRAYLTAASTALRGGKQPEQPDKAKLVRFSECMRANGILDFPDPTASGLSINRGGDLNPSNPTFQNASKVCAQKTGVQGFGGAPRAGTIELNGGA